MSLLVLIRLLALSTMPSILLLLRASASVKVSMFLIALCSNSWLAAITASALPSVSRTADDRSWPALDSAFKVGSSPSLAASGGEEASTPFSDTEAMPVRPLNSSVTRVSERIGVALSMDKSAATWAGSLVSSRVVTSPTRMPLNSTGAPTRKPVTEPSKITR